MQFPETHLDAVRLGSALLGRLPVFNEYNLKKIAYLESEVLSVRRLSGDHNIGYGNTYKTRGVTDIAIIPVGYKDGFMTEKSQDTFRIRDVLRTMFNDLKAFNRKYYVEINGKNYRIVGRVGMYNTVVDVTGSQVKKGDKVKLNINPLLINSNIINVCIPHLNLGSIRNITVYNIDRCNIRFISFTSIPLATCRHHWLQRI